MRSVQGWKSRVAVALLFGIVFLMVTFINHRLGASLIGNMANRDFVSLWTGGKALWLGLDPYDPQVWPDLRSRYGSRWIPDAICPFPLWTIAAFVPLSLLPLTVAAALWMTVSELSLILAVFLLVRTTGCPRNRLVTFTALLSALLFRPFLSALTSGQLTPLLLLLLAGAVAVYVQGRSVLAGLLFAFLLFKPNLFILFFPALVLLLLARRDWPGLIGLGVGAGGLAVPCSLLHPGWLPRWLGVSGKTSVTFLTPTLWGLAFDLVGPDRWILAGTLAVCWVSGSVLFLVVRRREEWLFGMALAMCSSLLVTPYLWNYDQLLLLLPALLALCRGARHHLLEIAACFVVLLVIPWGLFWVANLRGFDSLSVFVTVAVMGYLCVPWWGGDQRIRLERASSSSQEEGV